MSNITAAMVKELREITGAGMMECKTALVESNANIEEAIVILRKRGVAKAAKRADKTAAEGVIVAAVAPDAKTAYLLEVNCETDFVARDESFNAFAQHVAETGLAAGSEDFAQLPGIEEARQQLAHKLGENVQLRRAKFMKLSDGAIYAYNHGSRIGVLIALNQKNPELGKDIAMHIAALNPQALDGSAVDPALLEKERDIITDQAGQTGKSPELIAKMVEGRLAKYIKEICLLDQPFVRDADQTVAQLLAKQGATVYEFARFEAGEGIEKEVVDFAQEVQSQVSGSR